MDLEWKPSQIFPGELVEEAPRGIVEEATLFWGAWGKERETLPNLLGI